MRQNGTRRTWKMQNPYSEGGDLYFGPASKRSWVNAFSPEDSVFGALYDNSEDLDGHVFLVWNVANDMEDAWVQGQRCPRPPSKLVDMAQVSLKDRREVLTHPGGPYYPGQGPVPTYPLMVGNYDEITVQYVALCDRRGLPADTRVRMDHIIAYKTKTGRIITPKAGVPAWVTNALERWEFVH